MMTRQILSRAGMEQSEALLSLQRMARQTNEEIVRFVRQGDKWAATLQMIAEFPPSEDGGDEAPEPKAPKPAGADSDSDGPDDGPDGDSDSDDGGDGPDGPSGADGPPKPPGAEHGGGEMHAVVEMLHKMLQGLEQAGIVPKGPDPKMIPGQGPEHVPPPGPPAPLGPGGPPGAGGPPPGAGGPPDGGPFGGGKAAPYGNKLKPGEVPNKPGVVPVGAPSFASVESAIDFLKTALMGVPNGMMDPIGADPQSAPQQQPQQTAPGVGAGACPTCGQPGNSVGGGNAPVGAGLSGGVATTSAPPGMPPGPGSAGQQGSQVPSAVSAKTLTLQSSVGMTALEAHTELTAEFSPKGYKVTQLVPQDDGTYVAELTRS